MLRHDIDALEGSDCGQRSSDLAPSPAYPKLTVIAGRL
jgi:hypothetical protein